MVAPMKTTHIVRSLGIGFAAAWMLVQAPALAAPGGGGMAGSGGGGGDPGDCRCSLVGGKVSDLGGLAGAAVIGACLWRINRRRNSR
jgi:hypothetical protein